MWPKGLSFSRCFGLDERGRYCPGKNFTFRCRHRLTVTGSHVTISWKLKEIKSTAIEAKRVANKSTMVQT